MPIPPPLDTLVKILALEHRQGYADHAVIGGLDTFLARWQPGAGGAPDELVRRVLATLRGYSGIAPDGRRQRVSLVLQMVRSAPPDVPGSGTRASDGPSSSPRSTHAISAGAGTTGQFSAKAKPAAGKAGGAAKPVPSTTKRASGKATSASRSAKPPAAATRGEASPPDGLGTPIGVLPGVGDKRAALLAKLGVETVQDLLFHAPARYKDYSAIRKISALEAGEEATIIGEVWDVRRRPSRGRIRDVLTVILNDGSGSIACTYFNQPYLDRQFVQGERYVVSGRPELRQGRLALQSPDWEAFDQELIHTGRLVPVYPLTAGLSQRWLRTKLKAAVDGWAKRVPDPLPSEWRDLAGLPALSDALRMLHFPADQAEAARAMARLAFDELLALQLWSRQRRHTAKLRPGVDLSAGESSLQAFVQSLPFPLTAAQQRCLDEIAGDLVKTSPMHRLLQGDVGSGKTAVAAAACAMCVGAGWQSVIMAPTEILAEQHFAGLVRLLAPLGFTAFDPAAAKPARAAGKSKRASGVESQGALGLDEVAEGREFAGLGLDEVAARLEVGGLGLDEAVEGQGLALAGPAPLDPSSAGEPPDFSSTAAHPLVIARLVGSMKASEKAATAAAALAGQIDLLVGTHAVIQESVGFARLGLVVVDEQHRFGVLQRAELPSRTEDLVTAKVPHVLVMTATPIPRTLALVTNADLDQSVIDELPPGRKPVRTFWLGGDEREKAYQFIRNRIGKGEQAYIVYPLVEESEAIEARAAVAEHARLAAEEFADLELALVHGKLRPAEKERAMKRFYRNEAQILVATTVVEVGVDVANATVMLIDGADRFGLAQLHQLRGRVGRGATESVCLLLSEDPSRLAAERLKAMTDTTDGLKLAELDLKLRGPGDYFGLQQSGVVDQFKFARHATPEVLAQAVRVAEALMRRDPDLGDPALDGLKARMAAFGAGASRG